MVRVWHIVFVGSLGQPLCWWERLMDRDYLHCFALGHDGRHWIMVDARRPGTTVVTLPGAADTYPLADKDLEVITAIKTGLAVAGEASGMRVPHCWAPFTCVEVIKSLLGMQGAFIWTPLQLAKRLSL